VGTFSAADSRFAPLARGAREKAETILERKVVFGMSVASLPMGGTRNQVQKIGTRKKLKKMLGEI
jgi:hypothetical protein